MMWGVCSPNSVMSGCVEGFSAIQYKINADLEFHAVLQQQYGEAEVWSMFHFVIYLLSVCLFSTAGVSMLNI